MGVTNQFDIDRYFFVKQVGRNLKQKVIFVILTIECYLHNLFGLSGLIDTEMALDERLAFSCELGLPDLYFAAIEK